MKPSEQAAAYMEAKKGNQERRSYYLKLTGSFFEDKVIKKLRMLPGGDTYIVIVLKLFIESLKNESRIFYDGIEDSLAKELALTLDEKPEAIQVVLEAMSQYGWLIEESPGAFYSPKSAEMCGSISARTERWQRQQLREKTANIAGTLPNACQSIASDCQQLPQYKDIDIAIDKDIVIDRGNPKGERKFTETFFDCFETGKPKVIPNLSEVEKLCNALKTKCIEPGRFYQHFSSLNWNVDGLDITDWQLLLYEMEVSGVSV